MGRFGVIATILVLVAQLLSGGSAFARASAVSMQSAAFAKSGFQSSDAGVHWTGHSRHVLAMTKVMGSSATHDVPGTSALLDVACPAAGTCFGVGVEAAGTSAQIGVVVPITDGVPGTAVQVKSTAELEGIACSDADHCLAVGGGVDPKQNVSAGVVVPIIGGSVGDAVFVSNDDNTVGVACATALTCYAVGGDNVTGNSAIHTLSPNGTVAASNDVSGVNNLQNIACPPIGSGGDTPPTCLAVGANVPNPQPSQNVLVPITGGTIGSTVGAPGNDALLGAACPRPSLCEVAAGAGANGGQVFPVTISTPSSGPVGLAIGSILTVLNTTSVDSVACGGEGRCVLGGYQGTDTSSEGFIATLNALTNTLGQAVLLPGTSDIFGASAPQPLIVTSAEDGSAVNAKKGCATSAGPCTLRSALESINAAAPAEEVFVGSSGNDVATAEGVDYAAASTAASSIEFNMTSPHTPVISPTKALPVITKPISIDGTTEPGTASGEPGDEVSGLKTPKGTDGLVLQGGSSQVKGLMVTGFSGSGLSLQGSGTDTVTQCWIGVDRSGQGGAFAGVGNHDGIDIQAPNEVIEQDVISGNGDHKGFQDFKGNPSNPAADAQALAKLGAGVRVASSKASGLTVTGSIIGLAPDSSRTGNPSTDLLGAFGNPVGVLLMPASGALSTVTIGKAGSQAQKVILRNAFGPHDIIVTAPNAISGNGFGVFAEPAAKNASIAALTISGNNIGLNPQGNPVSPFGDIVGIAALTQGTGPITHLSIDSNQIQDDGMGLLGSGAGLSGATITGNMLGNGGSLGGLWSSLGGKNPSFGLHDLYGLLLAGAQGVTVGGPQGSGNTIGGDVIDAMLIGGSRNNMLGNTIGLKTPPSEDPNQMTVSDSGGLFGLLISGESNDVVGARPSHVSQRHIQPRDIIIQGGNTIQGTVIQLWEQHTTGGVVAANAIRGGVFGLWMDDNNGLTVGGSTQPGNTIVSNLVGILSTNVEPSKAEVKDMGASKAGVTAVGRADAFSQPGEQSAVNEVNNVSPVQLGPKSTGLVKGAGSNLVISNNLIGTDGTTSTTEGNWIAMWVLGDTTSMKVTNNTIAYSRASGVLIGPAWQGNTETGISLASNSIYSNQQQAAGSSFSGKGLGMDLIALGGSQSNAIPIFGPTANHSGKHILGPNYFENYPVVTSATAANGNITVQGSITTDANAHVVLQFFTNPWCTATGYGEGQTLLGTLPVTTPSSGVATFTHAFPTTTGTQLTANATELRAGSIGDTSEFSKCVVVR